MYHRGTLWRSVPGALCSRTKWSPCSCKKVTAWMSSARRGVIRSAPLAGQRQGFPAPADAAQLHGKVELGSRESVAPDGPEDEPAAGDGLGKALPPIRGGVMDEWGHRGRRPVETGFCQRWGVPGGRECPRRHSWTAPAGRGCRDQDDGSWSREPIPALEGLSAIWGGLVYCRGHGRSNLLWYRPTGYERFPVGQPPQRRRPSSRRFCFLTELT